MAPPIKKFDSLKSDDLLKSSENKSDRSYDSLREDMSQIRNDLDALEVPTHRAERPRKIVKTRIKRVFINDLKANVEKLQKELLEEKNTRNIQEFEIADLREILASK